jgi:hypothetical protein
LQIIQEQKPAAGSPAAGFVLRACPEIAAIKAVAHSLTLESRLTSRVFDVHAAFRRKTHQSLRKDVACRHLNDRQNCFQTGELKAGHASFIDGFA